MRSGGGHSHVWGCVCEQCKAIFSTCVNQYMLNNIVLHLPHTGIRHVCEQDWCVRVCAHFVYIVRIGEFQEWGINKNFGFLGRVYSTIIIQTQEEPRTSVNKNTVYSLLSSVLCSELYKSGDATDATSAVAGQMCNHIAYRKKIFCFSCRALILLRIKQISSYREMGA